MPLDLQILVIGAAAAIDTALLSSLLERRNVRNIAIPVVTLLTAAWLFHCGEFVRLLLTDAKGNWAEFVTWLAMTSVSAGLLLMPSSLLHATLRLWQTGLTFNVKASWHYATAYLPILLLPWAMHLLAENPDRPFLERVASLITPVATLICVVNVIAAMTFLAKRRHADDAELRGFLASMALLFALLTGLLIYTFWVAELTQLESGSPLLLTVILAPLGPTFLFAYFIIRYRFMQLLLERTFVYGAILAAAFLFHRLVIQSTTARLGDRFRVDFGILEAVGVFMLLLLYQPIRSRVAESLRYLFGRNVVDLRARTRRLAVETWDHLSDDPQKMVDWFVGALRELFEIKLVAAWILEPGGKILVRSGDIVSISEEQADSLHGALKSHSFVAADGRGVSGLAQMDLLRRMHASFAVRLDQAGFSGLLVLGPRSRSREYSEEEMNAVLLLVELLGATLHSHFLQAQRMQAEWLVGQNEKLSALGLLTSCLAHEIKNPLSSIKTIATVMGEQFGNQHPHAEDVRLILSEVERLSATTGQFLKFARPVESRGGSASIQHVVDTAVQVLASLARAKEVCIETDYGVSLPDVAADENTLREILFNLLLNAIEAVHRGGHVRVSVRQAEQFVVTKIHDDGPGITAALRERIFAPFVTNKPCGTGLGLFIVRRHVEHLGGQIWCDYEPSEETCFTVKLPVFGQCITVK